MAGAVTFLGQCADDQFKRWLADRPVGFYLNYQRKKVWMLHKPDCWHFGSGEGMKATTYSKVAAETVKELEKWTEANDVAILDCKDCRPRQD